MEGVFTLGKELHRLRHTRFMQRWKVQMQLWLKAAVINIKRALKQLARMEPVTRNQKLTNKPYHRHACLPTERNRWCHVSRFTPLTEVLQQQPPMILNTSCTEDWTCLKCSELLHCIKGGHLNSTPVVARIGYPP